MYITQLIVMLSGTMALPSSQPTRSPVGKLFCEGFCLKIRGCNVFSYLPVNLMCVLGSKTQEGFILYHMTKTTTDPHLCDIESPFQGQYLVSRSGREICVRRYPSVSKDKDIKIGPGHLLLVPILHYRAMLVDLKNMATKPYPYALTNGVLDLDYMSWRNELVLACRLHTKRAPVGKGRVFRLSRVGSHRCAVDNESEVVFLVTVDGKVGRVSNKMIYGVLALLHHKPTAVDVDPKLKIIFVSLGYTIQRISYKGRKKTRFITTNQVYGLSIDKSTNVLYALSNLQILIIDLYENTKAYVPILNTSKKYINIVNSKVVIISGSSILDIENSTLTYIGEISFNRTLGFATCVVP